MRTVSLAARIVLALVLTYVMLQIARNTSRGHPEFTSHSENGFTFEMTTVPKGPENGKARVELKISGPITETVHPVVHFSSTSENSVVHLVLSDSTTGTYFTEMNCGARGSKRQYLIEVRDDNDKILASFGQPNGTPFETKSIGEVPKPVLIGHIFFMFATVFCVAMGAISAFPVLFGKGKFRMAMTFFACAAAFTLVGGYPYGFAMNWYAFGGIWEGVPFGTDATDNKTQLLLFYLLLVALGALGTVTKGKFGRDIFGQKTLAALGVLALFLLLGIYLIPHSIQFSAATTYGVCYSFIGVCVLAYLVGFFRSAKRTL